MLICIIHAEEKRPGGKNNAIQNNLGSGADLGFK